MNISLLKTGALFVCLFTSINIYADVVKLNNGDVLSGKIISYADGLAIFKTTYGPITRLPIDNIIYVTTDLEYTVNFTNGDRAKGRLIANNRDEIVLTSRSLGIIPIKISDVISLIRDFPVNKEKTESLDTSYGESKDKTPPLDFLTGSTILLAKGEKEISLGFAYNHSRTNNSLQTVGYFQRSSYSARKAEIDVTLRAGLMDGVEGSISIPFTKTSIEQVSTNSFVRSSDEARLGDISLGIQTQIQEESSTTPALSLTFDISAPTGKKRYNKITETWLDPLNNGSGHWGAGIGLSFVRTTDPAILFGGIKYQHSFKEEIDGFKVAPGDVISSYVGVGFALNNDLSLGGKISFAYNKNMKLDGATIQGSHSTPIDLSFSASYNLDDWSTSSQVSFPINNEAGTPSLSFRLSRSM